MRAAQDYTWNALKAGFRPGMGQFIPDRFFWARQMASESEDESDGHGADLDREPSGPEAVDRDGAAPSESGVGAIRAARRERSRHGSSGGDKA